VKYASQLIRIRCDDSFNERRVVSERSARKGLYQPERAISEQANSFNDGAGGTKRQTPNELCARHFTHLKFDVWRLAFGVLPAAGAFRYQAIL